MNASPFCNAHFNVKCKRSLITLANEGGWLCSGQGGKGCGWGWLCSGQGGKGCGWGYWAGREGGVDGDAGRGGKGVWMGLALFWAGREEDMDGDAGQGGESVDGDAGQGGKGVWMGLALFWAGRGGCGWGC